MNIIELIKVIILGVVEGITEWLPISSTGHMILVDEFIKLDVSAEFLEMFLVVIQLGAILAVVVLYWQKLIPFDYKNNWKIKKDTFSMWFKIVIACIPAAIVGLLFDDQLNELFYNPLTVAIALIVFGILFIFIENYNKGKRFKITSLNEITYNTALIIGIFQLIAAIFPGTSRSGATIVGALLIGVSRTVAAEFTFFLAIPVMFGASLLKLIKFGLVFTTNEFILLIIGMLVAFLISMLTIKFLMSYIKKHDFKVFGWYRIVLGIIFGMVGGAFAWCLKLSKRKIGNRLKNPMIRIAIIGVCLSVLFLLFYKGRYSGLGTNLIQNSFYGGEIYSFDWLLKFILTILTLSAGFQGGEVTPLFSIGASLGVLLAGFFNLPIELVAALGYASVFGSATNTFFAPVFIGAEVFGYSYLPYFFVVCAISYIFNMDKSIYSLQKISTKQ